MDVDYLEIDIDPNVPSSQRLGTTHAYVLDEFNDSAHEKGWGALCYAMHIPTHPKSLWPRLGDVTKIRDEENHYVGCSACNQILHGDVDREVLKDA